MSYISYRNLKFVKKFESNLGVFRSELKVL